MSHLDEAIVMPVIGSAIMANDASEPVLKILALLLRAVGGQVHLQREFQPAVDLFVDQDIEVEHDPLQVEDEHVGPLGEEGALLDGDLLAALVALEV
jgi:hypothetical protein